MTPAVKTLFVLGYISLIASPIGFIIAKLVQGPNSEGHSGPGPDATKIIAACFTAFPFMTFGAILLIIAAVKRRRG